jgi:N utilization substance protein B
VPEGGRRQARERALSLLYEAESKDVTPAAVLAALPVEAAPFAADIVRGVGDHGAEIDKWIVDYARDWTIDRMPALDRALLRMGIFELLHRPDVPTGAVISEAVELAQRYSTDESSRFVNGMLARIAEAVRGPGSAMLVSESETVDAEAVGAEPAEDDEVPAGEMVEYRFDE